MSNNTSVDSVSTKEKVFAIFAYIGIFWFLGLLPSDVRESAYLKNHVNNGMVLFICEAILMCIPFLGWLVEIGAIVFAVLGIIAAAKNKYYSIPFLSDKVKLYW